MVKLSEYNENIIKGKKLKEKRKIFCGVACDDCGIELEYVNYDAILLSCPSKKEVSCPNCNKSGYMIT